MYQTYQIHETCVYEIIDHLILRTKGVLRLGNMHFTQDREVTASYWNCVQPSERERIQAIRDLSFHSFYPAMVFLLFFSNHINGHRLFAVLRPLLNIIVNRDMYEKNLFSWSLYLYVSIIAFISQSRDSLLIGRCLFDVSFLSDAPKFTCVSIDEHARSTAHMSPLPDGNTWNRWSPTSLCQHSMACQHKWWKILDTKVLQILLLTVSLWLCWHHKILYSLVLPSF